MRMLTVRDIADDLQLKPSTITGYLREGRIFGTRALGGDWRIRAEDYEAFKTSLFPAATGHGFSPRDARSQAAQRAYRT